MIAVAANARIPDPTVSESRHRLPERSPVIRFHRGYGWTQDGTRIVRRAEGATCSPEEWIRGWR